MTLKTADLTEAKLAKLITDQPEGRLLLEFLAENIAVIHPMLIMTGVISPEVNEAS